MTIKASANCSYGCAMVSSRDLDERNGEKRGGKLQERRMRVGPTAVDAPSQLPSASIELFLARETRFTLPLLFQLFC